MSLIKCHKFCTEGNKCICNGDAYHTLHICSDPKCKCHGPERYNISKTIHLLGLTVGEDGETVESEPEKEPE